MIAETMDSVTWKSHSRDLVLSGKSSKGTSSKLRVELEENLKEGNYSTSNSLNRGEIENSFLFNPLLQSCH